MRLNPQLPREKFHRLASNQTKNGLLFAPNSPTLSPFQRTNLRGLTWGIRGRAMLDLVYHRSINGNIFINNFIH